MSFLGAPDIEDADAEVYTEPEAVGSKRAVFRGGGSPSLRCGLRRVRASPYFGSTRLISESQTVAAATKCCSDTVPS